MSAAFGVDWAGASLRIVRMEGGTRSIAPVEAGVGDVRAAAARRACVPVAACLAQRDVFVRWVEAPYRSVSVARRVFPTLLDVELPFPLEECVCSFLDVHAGGSGRTRALAVGARRETVRRRLSALAEAGIDPTSLDVEALALWSQGLREFPCASGAGAELRAVLRLESEGGCLVAGRGVRLRCAHAFAAGDTARVHRALVAAFECDGAPVRWILAGGAGAGAQAAEMRRALTSAWPGSWSVAQQPHLFLARSLAIRAAERRAPLRCNLRTEELEHPAVAARRGRAGRWLAAGALAASLLLLALNAAVSVSLHNRRAADRARFRGAAERICGASIGDARGEHALRMVAAAVRRRESDLAPFRAVFERTVTDRFAAIVRRAAADGLRIESAALGPEGVSLSGSGPEWTSAEPLRDVLRGMGVEAELERQDANPEGRIPFRLKGTAAP